MQCMMTIKLMSYESAVGSIRDYMACGTCLCVPGGLSIIAVQYGQEFGAGATRLCTGRSVSQIYGGINKIGD